MLKEITESIIAIILFGLAEIGTVFVLYFVFYKDVRRRIMAFLKEKPSPCDTATRFCSIQIIMLFLTFGAFSMMCYLGETYGVFGGIITIGAP